MQKSEKPKLVSTFLVTASLNEQDMEAELLIEDPEEEVAIAAITNNDIT